MRTNPCGVYVHVPFCRRRCPYCDFAFEVRDADARFVDGVVAEYFARRGELPHAPTTLSLGGGTPSSLPAHDVARLVDTIAADVARDGGALAEIALELNPEDVDAAYAHALKDAGVTRVSIGVQSFDDDVLRYLGRAHDGARASRVVDACVAAGLRVGVDLIIGVPGERIDRFVADAQNCAARGVGHVSAYVLTLEENTPLVQLIATQKRASIDEDEQADAYERAQEVLPGLGYPAYEISSYAKTGDESAHNRIYWGGGAYLGLGPSAHSMRIDDDKRVIRRHTLARFDEWIGSAADARCEREVLTGIAAFSESVAFGLRDLQSGVAIAERARRLGVSTSEASPVVRALEDEARFELVRFERDDEGDVRVFLTAKGARFADRVARAVLAAADDT